MGPPPPEFVARGSHSSKFFNEQGEFTTLKIDLSRRVSLADLETSLENEDDSDKADRDLFLKFMGKMLQWDPKDRHTARQLLTDEWLRKHAGYKKPEGG
ncbi:hypothetical protein H0H93_012528 [Arthromyces matolae]|nr:hypothetical protein H0H93_012528 [Arthromyces matolae]